MANPNSFNNQTAETVNSNQKEGTTWEDLADEPFRGNNANRTSAEAKELSHKVTRSGEHTKIIQYEDGHSAIESEYYDLPEKFSDQSPESRKNPELSNLISSASFDLSLIDLFQEHILSPTLEDKTIKRFRSTAYRHAKQLYEMSQNGHSDEVDRFLELADNMGEAGGAFAGIYESIAMGVEPTFLEEPDTASVKKEAMQLAEAVDQRSKTGRWGLEEIHELHAGSHHKEYRNHIQPILMSLF